MLIGWNWQSVLRIKTVQYQLSLNLVKNNTILSSKYIYMYGLYSKGRGTVFIILRAVSPNDIDTDWIQAFLNGRITY